ncbi:transporter substrate-binding domain-containing protein [Gordonia sp. CPCC 205333]|uniref:transporter substrate-binding domain-containing protein n=1 Tax=Gordonia sp. CPCC 205333 TaxID=3140790 RepID=UPI003AF3C5FC
MIGTDPSFEPIIVARNGQIIGFDADVASAIGRILGVRPVFRQDHFGSIIPAIRNGTYDTGLRGIFDTIVREREVDMVTYFSAGTQWAQRTGANVDPNNACGLKVSVSAGTVQSTVEIPAKSQACTTVGEKAITAVPFEDVRGAVSAVRRGEVDAISADSPVTEFSVHQSGGTLTLAGDIFDTDPYALPVAKGSPLGPVLRAAVQRLIESGEIQRIARKWGLENGLIKKSTVNAATN